MRRKSMQGVVLLAAGILAIPFVFIGTVWLIAPAVVCLAAGVVMLYQVGKSLS